MSSKALSPSYYSTCSVQLFGNSEQLLMMIITIKPIIGFLIRHLGLKAELYHFKVLLYLCVMTEQASLFLNDVKKSVLSFDPGARLFLFGSRARGDFREDSDWDILILLNRDKVDFVVKRTLRKQLFKVELDVGQPISAFVYSNDEWTNNQSDTPFFQNIASVGIPI